MIKYNDILIIKKNWKLWNSTITHLKQLNISKSTIYNYSLCDFIFKNYFIFYYF